MALNFPASPVDGQIYYDSVSGNRYVYSSTYTSWLSAANSQPLASNTQILYINNGAIVGSNGVQFYSNTLYVANISTSENVTSQYFFGNGAFLTGVSPPIDLTAANNYAGYMANSANAYAASLTPDLSPVFTVANASYNTANAAFDKANTAVYSLEPANNWANTVGTAGNNYTNAVGVAGNNYTNAVGVAGNSYTDTATVSANNYASILIANNAVGANNWANTKLANTDNVIFNGSLQISNTIYARDLVLSNSMIANISSNVYDLYVRNNVFIGGAITNVTQLVFNTGTNITPSVPGALTWSQDDSTLHFDMDTPSNVIAHIGQDQFYLVKNQTGETISKGTVVRFAGTLGASGRLLISKATANNSIPSSYVMGVTAADIGNGADGFVLSFGKIRGLDMSMFSAGDILYLSPTTPGALQNTQPTAPNNKVSVAAVIHNDNIQGTIQVRPALGSRLNNNENAEINGVANGDLLRYNSANSRFENFNENVTGPAINATAAFAHSNATAIGANNWANTVGTAGNNYTNTVGTSGNNYASILAANNAVGANAWANSIGTASNSYTNSVGTAGNNYTNSVGTAGNNYVNTTFVKLTAPGTIQTITSDVAIVGNLSISGNTTSISANNLSVNDSLIYLANGNFGDLVDIGFVASYSNTTAHHVHTGLFRDHATKEYFLFQGYDGQPELSTDIVPYSNNMSISVLNADIIAGNITLGSTNVYPWIAAAYNTANSSNGWANTVGISGNNYASILAANNAAGSNAWANTIGTAGNNYTNAVGSSSNSYANYVGASGNSYTNYVGSSANNYAGYMANSSNSLTTAIATSGNNYTDSVGASGNNYTNAVGTASNNYASILAANNAVGANGWANTVGTAGNNYTNAVGLSANNYAGYMANAANNYANSKGGSVNVGATAPVGTSGALWWDTNSGRMYIYYTDADSSQWVDASPTQLPTVVAGGYYAGNRGTIGTTDALNDIFRVHSKTITSDITIPAGYNALAAGPLTIQNGIRLTIGEGSRTVIV